MYYTSPTFGSAIHNSIPAFTFVMASVLTYDILAVHKISCRSLAVTVDSYIITSPEKMLNRIWGCVYFIGQCLSYAGWMVVQVPLMKNYPAKLSLSSFTCFFGLIQLLVIAVFIEMGMKHWHIQSVEVVFMILYVGIANSGIVYFLMTWCIQKGGPVFAATCLPVQTILVVVMAFMFLGDQLYSGVVFGGILIAAGLYLVLWGKTVEEKFANQDDEATTLRTQLLDHKQGRIPCYSSHPKTILLHT
uniref:WAT1-related protein n=1 Tax=Nicotiana tabacum TaxID=4097 RepID=A0A1S4AQN3_TOBAC|nr:PREDICTED: WAT1-related protein At3g18200-like [Nicotiana tabacum]